MTIRGMLGPIAPDELVEVVEETREDLEQFRADRRCNDIGAVP
jgi:hypothetical protein